MAEILAALRCGQTVYLYFDHSFSIGVQQWQFKNAKVTIKSPKKSAWDNWDTNANVSKIRILRTGKKTFASNFGTHSWHTGKSGTFHSMEYLVNVAERIFHSIFDSDVWYQSYKQSLAPVQDTCLKCQFHSLLLFPQNYKS